MTTHTESMFEVKNWDETPVNEGDGLPKITRARVTVAIRGEIEAEGVIEYLMAYQNDGSASFVRVERVTGSLGGKKGSFVLQGTGTYEKNTGIASGNLSVVPQTGTGELQGLKGDGKFFAQRSSKGTVTLNYELETSAQGERS